ncbi:hypothetical protein NUU61_001393 [Penicillium alfredii]|uniref:Uncharacterized protein n=1 Tax=Penicillium alfredii TaxID=1506179 RepID=A0A9W9KN98_9EURO|nr:uncharacterized protein NUU61_001393 [Penicillium alfredii]KAJ5111763.1 hypothetical protein NUU61_001393 [Penicillium alfredii]
MDIEKALKVLRDAPVEAFMLQISETLSTIQHVDQLLGTLITRGSESSVTSTCRLCKRTSNNNRIASTAAPGLSGIEPNRLMDNARISNQKHNSDQHTPEQPTPEQPTPEQPTPEQPTQAQPAINKDATDRNRSSPLLKAVIEALPLIWSLSRKKPSDIISKKRAHQRDKRLDHILRFENGKSQRVKSSVENKLLRGIAQRSLALEYSRYQDHREEKRRTDEMCYLILRPPPEKKEKKGNLYQGRSGTIRLWLRQYLTFAAEDENIVFAAVNAGIKQLIVEELLKRRLRHAGLSLDAVAISAATALTIQQFKALPLKDILSFVDLVLESQTEVKLSKDQLETFGEGVQKPTAMKVIDKTSPWSPSDGILTEMIYSDVRLEEVSRKRHRSSSPSNSGSYNGPEEDPPPASPQSNSDSGVISNTDCATSELLPAEAVDQNQHDDLVTSAPLGTSPFSPNNTRSAANIRPINASQIPFDDVPNEQSASLPEETHRRALHGQISDTGVFYPLDYYPNLAEGTQNSPDSQLLDGFNALNFPSLALDAQSSPGSQLLDGFNALNFPNLALDAQLPPDSYLSDRLNALNFPDLVLGT